MQIRIPSYRLERTLLVPWMLKHFCRLTFVVLAILLSTSKSIAQVQIQDDQSNNITNTTITLCGSNDFDLISSIPAVAQQDTLTWSWTKLSGAGTLSISNSAVTQPTFTPTSTGLDYYAINLAYNTDSTNASIATVNVAIAPNPNITSLSLPASVCENDGIQTLTNSLGANQTLTSSAGAVVTSGSNVTFDPQGLSNGSIVTLTLTETFTVPSTTITFTCSSTQTLTVYTASTVTLSLGTTSFQKCSAVTSLSGGSPSGGVYTVAGFPNAVNSSGQIDPSQLPVGSHTVTYTYTNSSGCTSSNTQNITITGFNFSGASVNFAVSEVTTTGPSPILATSFNGITTYSICSGGANATFLLSPLAGLSNFTNYSIDWGDGGAVQTGTYSSTNLITHQYNTAGLYTTTVQLSTSTGCSIDTTINLYFGSTQTLGLSTPGNTTVCLAPGQDSVYFDFEISNWQNDPDGISYTFNSNDGSSKPAVSPLINGGVSQFPFIIYDATTQKAYYRHYFQGSSCNYTSSLGGTTYNNTYSVSATKTAPCPGSQSTAAVGPIVISESPEAHIVGDDSVCTSTNYLVQDLSGQGKMVVASGSDFTCDPTANGYWEVYDSQWNLLTLPNNKFSLNTGSSLGSGGIFPTVPAYWTSGSNNLNLQFLQSGTYNIVKHIGLTAFGGNTLCTLDIDTISVCVDTIAITEIAISIANTICVGTVTNSAVYQDSINCNSPSSYSLFVFDESNVLLFNSTSPTDTSFNWTPSLSGKMTLRYGVSNQCGVSYIYDSIIVIDEPNVSFPPNDSIYCTDTLLVNLGSPTFSVISTSPYASADSVYYFITPQTGWTSLGLNQYGHDSLILWDRKNYTIHARAYNDCGSQVLSTQIQLDSIPNPYFTLTDTTGCSPFTPTINSIYHNNGKSHTWKIYLSGVLQEEVSGINPSFSSYSTNNTNVTYTIWHIVESTNGCIDSTSILFHVVPNPDADFSISAAACAPWTPTITNNSTGNNLSFDWDISPLNSLVSLSDTSNTTPTLAFAGLQYPDSDQQYTLSLLTTSDSGCTDSYSETITLYARPLADFSLSNDSSCGPFTLSPTESSGSNGTINSWQWTVIDDANATTLSSSTLQNPSFNLPTSTNGVTTYLIQLIVQDSRGCSDTTTTSFYINPTPTAAFTLASNTCTGTNINSLITNNSSANDNSNNQLTYNWTIDSAGTAFNYNDSIPSHILLNNDTTTLTYTVSLTVTNQYGCDSTISNTIDIYPNANADINTDAITDCAPLTIDTSIVNAIHYAGNGSYTWSVLTTDSNFVTSFNGINALNYTISNDDTSFIIRLVVSSLHNCLNDTAFVTVTTIGNPNPYWSLVDSAGCAPFTPVIDSLTADAALTHTWIIYDSTGTTVHTLNGNNPTWPALNNNSYTNNNSYNIKHIVQAGTGCKDSASITVTVWPTPLASFQSDTVAACAPWTPLISNNSQGNGLTFVWSLDTTVHTSFSAINDSTPNLSFSDVQWPQADQQYNLTLSVTSDKGCTDDTTQSITLHARPKAGFILPQDSCGVFLLQPQDTSKTNGSITDWLWTLTGPNGSTSSSLNNPTFNLPQSFNGIQNYTLRLQVTNNNGCIDTLQQNFTVFPTPTASFTLSDSICTGASINTLIINSSSANDGTSNLDYYWSIDTAGTTLHSDTNTIPTYTLVNTTTGYITYFVSLTVTNQYGCDSTITDSIVVFPNAIAQLNTDTISDCAPLTIDTSIVNAIHYAGNGSYTWSVLTTDSNFVTSFNGINALNYTISNDDTSFIIRLVVSSLHNCLNDTAFVTVTTIGNPNPYWSLVDSAGCAPFTPVIDSLTADAALTHTWIIYDSTGTTVHTLNGNNPTWPALNNNSYTNNNSYNIKHIVQAGTGCKDSASITVTVWPTPLASFQSDTVAACAPWTPLISNNSQGNGLTFVWSLDTTVHTSFSAINDSTPNLSFSDVQWPQADQQYNLTLSVTSDKGCTDDTTQSITLHARPKAGFILPQDSCGVFLLQPQDTSKTNGSITDWLWTLTGPNGSTSSSLNNPTFNLPQSFNGIQNYTLRLQVTNNNGCIDTLQQNFTVFPTPTASFTLSDSICTGASINTLIINSSSANDGTSNLDYYWSIDTAGTTLHSDTNTIPTYTLVNTTTGYITYFVSLTVTNQYGCDSTITDSIVVFPNAIAQLNTDTISDCAPLTIDTSIVNAIHYAGNGSYTWSVKNTAGTVLSTFNGRNNLNHNISASENSVWVVLQVTSLHGCLDNKDSVLVYTLPNPNPYFGLAADTGCTAFNPIIDSIGQSTGLHVWEIFDSSNNQIGNTLVGNAPILPTLINNNTSGLSTYTITHTVFAIDSSSCDSSYTQNVYVYPLSIPSINTIGFFCGFDTIPLSATSTNNANVSQWMWTIGSDTLFGQNINYYNPTPGNYGISLTTTTLAGCDTTIYDSLTIHSYPVADISISDCGVDTVCLNQSFNFFDASSTSAFGGSIASFAWDFDDNGSIDYTTQNGSHSYSSTGLKSLRLTVTTQYGCIDDTIINIYVNAPPINSFEITDSALCGPTTFNVLESDTGIVDSSYYELFTFNGSTKTLIQSWNSLPNPLPTLQPNYIADTVYYLSREIFNCCGSDYVEDSIIIRTPPVADFVILPDTGCTPLNTIIQIDGLIKGQADSAYFDFGDGSNTSILPTKIQQGSSFIYQWGQLNHVFTYGGTLDTTYYVTLTVFNDCGDSSLTLPVYVEPNTVQAAFGMDKSSGCSPLTVNFTNYSYNTTNTAWCFDWDVATNSCNGGGSVNQNPTWTFTQPGTYTVALLVDNGCGYDTTFQNVTVFPSPVAVISSNNNVCANDSVNFISNSTTSAGFIAGHLWEFGNGDTSILQNVDYLYDTSGVYTVTLTVTSSTGCSDSTSATINIRPTPEVNFTTQNVCLNDTTFFENLTTLSNGQIIGNAWNFGDGNSSNAFEPYHIYNAPGTYQVTLTHTSDYGCVDSSQQIAIVHDLPQLSFTPSLINGDSCSVPQTYLFTNNSTNAIQFNWDFDYANNPGINTSTLTNPTFNYTSAGIYTVALFAETAFGCIDSLFTNILVRDGVNARHIINPTEGCEPLDVTFTDTSIYTSSLDTIVSVEWFFGNGNSFIQTTAPFVYNYRYDNYGTYVVYNVVTMASGCLDTSAHTTINVYPTPDADFTISQVNIDTRTFVNLTSFVDSSITYYWTFSDGQTSTDISPTIRFEPSTSGLDSIKACLYVVNSFGCADSICKSFWVWPTNLIVPNAFAPDLNYIGEDALFLPKGHSLKEYEIWIYDQWGSLVWYSNEIDPDIKSPAEGWDGKHMDSGEPLPMGVYAWRIRALFDNNEFWTGQDNTHGFQKAYGTLTLIR